MAQTIDTTGAQPTRLPTWWKYLNRARVSGALALLVAFVLLGGYRALDDAEEDKADIPPPRSL